MGYFSASEIAWFAFTAIAISVIIYKSVDFFLKEKVTSALLSILFSYFFFNGHHIYLIYESKIISYEYFATQIYSKILTLLLLIILSIVIFIVTYKSLKKFRDVTVKFFIFFLIISLLVDIYMIFNQRNMDKHEEFVVDEKHYPAHSNHPNIYYIILDSYTSLESLQKFWNYSDKSLELILNQKNINYSVSGHTKFASTPYCMSSTLNMRWEQQANTDEIGMVYQSLFDIRNNAVVSILQSNNYQIKNLSLFKIGGEGNFYSYFPEVSIWGNSLPFLIYRMIRKLVYSPYELRVNFDISREIIAQSKINSNHRGPVFTYAHLMLPHSRYLLDSAGALQKNLQLPDEQKYLSQLKFARKALVYFFTTIIKNDPRSVIIVQGDHGFRYLDNAEDRKKEAFTMFNAIYLSGDKLPKDTLAYLNNPTNNFRIVLNKYFGMKIKLTTI